MEGIATSRRLRVTVAATRSGLLVALVAVSGLSSCARHRAVNYAAYEQIPNTPASATFRTLARALPATRERVFYGRYGGPGNQGGKPVDEMDEWFRRHDIVYYLSRTGCNMRAADRQLVEKLEALDESDLSSEGRAYRDRVVKFFRSSACYVIGKPWSSYYTFREPDGSCFPNEGAVLEFFDPRHDGFPVAPDGRRDMTRF